MTAVLLYKVAISGLMRNFLSFAALLVAIVRDDASSTTMGNASMLRCPLAAG